MKEKFCFNTLLSEAVCENKKIIICPDSFKGTMNATTVADIIAKEIKIKNPYVDILEMPIADGGEGTLDCFKQILDCEIKSSNVKDAFFKPIDAEYVVLPNGVAVVEVAKIVGLYLIEKKNPSLTSTYGIGEIIRKEAKLGHKILLALGGSSTTDGGAGVAAASGAKFFNFQGEEFIPTGGTLCEIKRIDTANIITTDITCLCDVKNHLYGKNGAAYVFAPQKGADENMVDALDRGLQHYSNKIKEFIGIDISKLEGGGAAGGISAGLVAFFGAEIKSGIETVLDIIKFDSLLENAALVVTGEGKLDDTSFSGKAIGGIIKHAKAHNVPVVAVCGQIANNISLEEHGLVAAFSTNTAHKSYEEVKVSCEQDLQKITQEILRI